MPHPTINGDVLVVGDVMRDIIVKPHGTVAHGSDTPATIQTLPGGSGANQAVWLGAFKVPVRFLARIGAADHAVQTKMFLEAGVTPLLKADPELQTGQLVTLVDPDGERSFFTDRGANEELAHSDFAEDILHGVGLLHLSGYAFFAPKPRGAALHLIKLAKAQNIPISVDPASVGFLQAVGPATFLRWTEGADFCFPNADEAAVLTGTNDPKAQLSSLAAHYELVVLKLGADGAIAGNVRGNITACKAKPATAVDTTGAGDAFLSGFIAAWINGAELQECLHDGCAAGSDAISRLGGRPG